jgi:hypothetical protein
MASRRVEGGDLSLAWDRYTGLDSVPLPWFMILRSQNVSFQGTFCA